MIKNWAHFRVLNNIIIIIITGLSLTWGTRKERYGESVAVTSRTHFAARGRWWRRPQCSAHLTEWCMMKTTVQRTPHRMMQVAHPRSRQTKRKEEEYTEVDKVFIIWKGNINWMPLNVYFWDMPILKKKSPKIQAVVKIKITQIMMEGEIKHAEEEVTDAGKQSTLSQCLFRLFRDFYTWVTT